jgi:hypothetical protein
MGGAESIFLRCALRREWVGAERISFAERSTLIGACQRRSKPGRVSPVETWTAHVACGGVGVKNSDHTCDLRLRPIWPPVRSARIAFPETRVRTPPPTELAEI